ncbi:large conductance mechanosensitive channel protein MscL [uncultured Polaribacter sp.]|uniref:large conductance mechanosensitive channel protein MscL n=1 Tax=uncultured Polaribacter sp. TaxID=174711 RepID=UPI00261BBDEC|nr:large conductance mechanosensitive channel protein MscL [uncultured Polaribacter sp.]
MFKEFKEFITGGNVIEFAVAVIMAGAIGSVVKGFVSNIVMPVVGLFTGGVSFSDKKFILTEAVLDATGKVATPENAILYGAWIDSIINLVIVGFVMFLMIKSYNKTKKKEVPAPEAPKGPSQEELLAEIRDLLSKK